MIGSVKSMTRSSDSFGARLTVSIHSGLRTGTPARSYTRKVHLVDVKRVNLICRVHNTPMSVGPDLCASHRFGIWGKLPIVDVEAVFIFGELHCKIRGAPLQAISGATWKWLVYSFVIGLCIDGMGRGRCLRICVKIGQDHRRVRISVSTRIDAQASQRCCVARFWTIDDDFNPASRSK